jgi:tetratricopeptide (TPR) repeat protein
VDDLTQVVEVNPHHVLGLLERGRSFYGLGKHDLALADLTKALEVNPQFAGALYHRALAHQAMGQYAKAIEDLSATIRLEPEAPAAYNDLAWILEACPEEEHRDGKFAVKSAQKACQLAEEPSGQFLDTLATAYAANGQFDLAVETQTQALTAVEDERQKEVLRNRLKLFEQKKPYLDPPVARPSAKPREF